jgi:hypothetical protein
MKPVYWVIAIVAGVGLVAGWQFVQTRKQADERLTAQAAAAAQPVPTAAPVVAQAPTTTPASAPIATADRLKQWIADTGSTDAGKRSTAITALAQGPREEVLPVLRRVLLNGEPTVDRPLALKSLRDLALAQGDPDNRVRQAMREVIYHGDDEALAAGAQEAIDAVEVSEARSAAG